MSTTIGPAILTLSSWLAQAITTLLESKTQADFDKLFETTFSPECSFTVNGKQVTREHYKSVLLEQSGATPFDSNANVATVAQLSVDYGEEQLSGVAGVFYTVIESSEFLVLGAPTQRKTTSSINAVIKAVGTSRRVTQVNQVISEVAYHATIPASSIPGSINPGGPEISVPHPHRKGPFGDGFGLGPVQIQPGGPLVPEPGTQTVPPEIPSGLGPGPVTIPPNIPVSLGPGPVVPLQGVWPGEGEGGPGPVIVPDYVLEERTA